MTTNYAKHVQTRCTPQNEPVRGKNMVPNNAGGYVFDVGDWARLDRFLILGSETGTYYVGERELTKQNTDVIERCLAADAGRTINRIVEVSQKGLAPKNDPAIFALAVAACSRVSSTSAKALSVVHNVCRIGTHLFQFVSACTELRGWWRGLRRAVSRWYTDRPTKDLIYQTIKYQNRHGWSHRDVLRSAHPRPLDPEQNIVFRWVVGKGLPEEGLRSESLTRLEAFEILKRAKTVDEAAALILKYDFPRECVPSQFLTTKEVWSALLEKMPATALVRNLGNLSKVGLLVPFSDATKEVVRRLEDETALKKARVHPLSLLIALKMYARGAGYRGDGSWTPVRQVIDVLDQAFYKAFDYVEPTGQNLVVAIDGSGSMEHEISGSPLSCREAAIAIGMVHALTEKWSVVLGFTMGSNVCEIPVSKGQRLDDVIRTFNRMVKPERTDCALPYRWAYDKKAEVDGFVLLTDNETWSGSAHPYQYLNEYRRRMGRNTKTAVVGMTATNCTVGDTGDPGTLNVVGFDPTVPQVVSNFLRGS